MNRAREKVLAVDLGKTNLSFDLGDTVMPCLVGLQMMQAGISMH